MDVKSGSAQAYGYDLFNACRFMRDNFLTFLPQIPVLIDIMTSEQQIRNSCVFAGMENIEEVVQQTLATYNLKRVSNIASFKLDS